MISDENRLQLGANLTGSLPEDILEGPLSYHDRPRGVIGRYELQRAQARTAQRGWAADFLKKLQLEAVEWLNRDITVPTLGGGHGMWFLSPTGAPLRYDREEQTDHYCERENRSYCGSSYDAGWRYYRHVELIRLLKQLAVVGAVRQDTSYLHKAKALLLEYAVAYTGYQVQERGGRLFWQSLDEAVAILEICQAYDLLAATGMLTEQERSLIELQLLRPSALAISQYEMGRSNWQAWHAAAIGMIGFVVNDRRMMDYAIHGPSGFHCLMKHSVLPDGFWWEGAIAYHLYALNPLHMLAEAAKRWGYDLYSDPKLMSMFKAPLEYTYPDLSFPANNDGGRYGASLLTPSASNGHADYEAAYAHYSEALYGHLLSYKYGRAGVPREGYLALFLGVDEIPPTAHSIVLSSRDFEGIGHAVLRSEEGLAPTFVLLDYGPYGGSHGHSDKLHLDIYGAGGMLAPDLGTSSYGHPLYLSWYKTTISHNTVVVDGLPQQEAGGRRELFVDSRSMKVVRAVSEEVYPGIRYERTVWLLEDVIIDRFTLRDKSGDRHRYDWLLHGLGVFETEEIVQQAPNVYLDGTGYQHLEQPCLIQARHGMRVRWTQEARGLEAMISDPGEVYTVQGPGPATNPEELTPILLHRKEGAEADFLSMLRPYLHGASKVEAALQACGDFAVLLKRSGHTEWLYCNPNTEEKNPVAVRLWIKGELQAPDEPPFILTATGSRLQVFVTSCSELLGLAFSVRWSGIKEVYVNDRKAECSYREDGLLAVEWKRPASEDDQFF